MSQINPFTGALSQTPQLQRLQAADKDRHLRRVQDLKKNVAAGAEGVDHQVESADAIVSIHDEQERQRQQGKRRPVRKPPAPREEASGDEPPHLDLTA